MIKIVILGTGNVATHFISAFKACEAVKVIQIYNHREDSLVQFNDCNTTTDIDQLMPADIYLICVKDDLISNLANKINQPNSIIAHTSGSVPLLKSSKRNAVFYPLQTFSKDKKVNFKDLPICIESQHKSDFKLLKKLAINIEAKVYEVNSKQRQELHLAAVFVCNFVNHLYHIGHEICKHKDLPFDILKPLINETADKINQKTPKDAQTGPALRKDHGTINRHINQLDGLATKELYRYLTASIQQTYD